MPPAINATQGAKISQPAVKSTPKKPPPVKSVKKSAPSVKAKSATPSPKGNKVNIVA